MEKGPIVKVKSEEGRTLVIETPEGKEQTFYLNPSDRMNLHMQNLQVHQSASTFSFSIPGDPDPEKPEWLPELSVEVKGAATLGGGFISVIGEPTNKAHSATVSFHIVEDDFRKQMEESWAKKPSMPRFAGATVGFSRAHGEIGKDEWSIDCYVSPAVMIEIADAVTGGQLRAMTLDLKLRNIYSDVNWSRSLGTTWFLRPNRSDNSISMPDTAHGEICFLNLELARFEVLSKLVEDEPEEEPEIIPEAAPDPQALALKVLAANIEKLRSTLKWIGGLVFAALLLVAFK